MPKIRNAESDADVLTVEEQAVELPRLYRVLLHNDDFTTMDFVVGILQDIFQKSAIEAVSIMLKVHNEGIGVAGIYTYEIAKTKARKAMDRARAREFPLLITIEPEPG
ncbi:MAG: ATP-dependent Clp protease adaptor ClpS [Pyrinomonadaceae bacterium]|jgi:ATP-dependent Clp protease adaptor protein ClpS